MEKNSFDIEYLNKIDKEKFITLMYQFFNSPNNTLQFIDEMEKNRPFLNGLELYKEFLLQIKELSHIDQLRILENQDELGSSKKREEHKYSKKEHSLSGLNDLSPEDFDRFKYLNRAYKSKFGFNFLLAVSGLDSNQILSMFENRISNTFETEFFTAITQLEKLTFLRIRKNLEDPELKKTNFLTINRNDCL